MEGDLGVEIALDKRFEGFQWLESVFVVFFAEAADTHENAILLPGEPEFSLHAHKQRDFRDTVSRLVESNQTLYTTHSPFLVGPGEVDFVRVVEMRDRKVGTTVHTAVTSNDPAALLLLQEALGYDLAESLFAKQRSLVLEGLTDHWYVEATAALLASDGTVKLNDRIALITANAAGKVVYFATILHAHGLRVAALLDPDAAGDQAAKQEVLVHTLCHGAVLRTKNYLAAPVAKAEFEDLSRETLIGIAKAEFGWAAAVAATSKPERPLVDILLRVSEFKKDKFAKAYIRWTRDHQATDLAEAEREQWRKLIDAVNAALESRIPVPDLSDGGATVAAAAGHPHLGLMSNEFDVIIVGGGAAGIGAARRLVAQGKATLVLEASSRLGGRAFTQDLGDYPLDLGCEWLHSGDRNVWVRIAEASGFPVDRSDPPWAKAHPGIAWDGDDEEAARWAFGDWEERLRAVARGSDRASDALEPGGEWNAYVRAIAGFLSGVAPERISATDYLSYDDASTGRNWTLPLGYGTLVAASLPSSVALRLATPVERIDLTADGVAVATRAGTVRAGAAIVTVSTAVLATDAIRLPAGTEPWREAAAALPLGRNEKVFLEIGRDAAFERDSHAYGDLRDPRSASYSIRPNGWPVIEAFLGGEGALILEEEGPAAGFSYVSAQLVALFGSDVASAIRPLAATAWSRMSSIGGAYSCALPGQSNARARLATPFEDRLFFAGEATHPFDFTTAHGAHDSGQRAADEALSALGGRPVLGRRGPPAAAGARATG